MSLRLAGATAIVAVVGLALAACGSDDEQQQQQTVAAQQEQQQQQQTVAAQQEQQQQQTMAAQQQQQAPAAQQQEQQQSAPAQQQQQQEQAAPAQQQQQQQQQESIAEAAEKEPIIFSDLNWTSSEVQTRIVAFIVEHGYGYPTDLIAGDTVLLWEGPDQQRHPGDAGNLARAAALDR